MQRLAVLVLTAALAIGSAVGTASAASASDAGTVTVKGHVSSPTGRAVAGVRVSLRGKPRLSAHPFSRVVRTSATGRYEVRVPRVDFYDLRVTDPGDDGTWAPTFQRITSGGTSIVADQVVHHGATVSGRVLDSSGRRVGAGLAVHALVRTPNADGRSTLRVVATTSTRASGAYAFHALPAAKVLLAFSSPTPNGGERFRTEHAGGSLDPADASAVPLRFGGRYVGLGIRFPVVARISGSLTVDGKALPGDDGELASVELLYAGGTELDSETALSSFTFADLAAGTYFLRFQLTDTGDDVGAPVYFARYSTLAGATPITVTRGQAVAGLSVALRTR